MMKIKSKKQVLWDDLRISVYGPWNLQYDRKARGRVEDLMGTLTHVVKQCFKDCAKQTPVLKGLRIKVEK